MEPNQIDLYSEDITYSGETGEIRASLKIPQGDDKLAGVLVIHENRGLDSHIKDVVGRVAREGFIALGPDGLSPLGGTPENADEGPELTKKLDGPSTTKNYLAAVKYLKTHPRCSGKIGVVGFCWGGALTNQLAVHSEDLAAAVPFYGRQPAAEDVAKIKAALLLHYAGLDEKINAGISAYEAALKAAAVEYTLYVYEGAKHAFHNDEKPDRYNKEAAQLAWRRTVSFFNEKLKT